LIYAYVDGNIKIGYSSQKAETVSLCPRPRMQKQFLHYRKDHMSSFSGGLRNEMFSVLMNSDGEKKVYHKINANSLKGEQIPTNAIGKANVYLLE
jgi:hypothetical protein